MNKEIKYKLNQIAEIWNYYILNFDLCRKKINYNSQLKTNYFGDILEYFKDTFDVIYDNKTSESFSDYFLQQTGLLQSIYIQQDFIEELLIIFKCNIVKGDLMKDENYSLNREIRNELVGHPIRKPKGELISSCIFSYNTESDKLIYLRYHKDNNYKFESREFLISEIINRHNQFLNKYFDKILHRLKHIILKFTKEIEKIENLIDQLEFLKLLNILNAKYPLLFIDSYYSKELLEKIYLRQDEHLRYKNYINKFYLDLKNSISETKRFGIDIFNIKNSQFKGTTISFDIEGLFQKMTSVNTIPPISYNYELGKIFTKRNPDDFNFFANILRRKFSNNDLHFLLEELDNMELNLNNDVEFYSSYLLIENKLNN